MASRYCLMLLTLCLCASCNLAYVEKSVACIEEPVDYLKKLDDILTSQTLQTDSLTSPVLHSDCSIFPQIWSEKKDKKRFTTVDIKSQHLACYESGKLVRVCDICTARKGDDWLEDLIGDWRVLIHSENATSTVYKDDDGNPFPMPWAVAIGGGYWIHQGKLPGHPASGGCIRMRATNAEWYFNWSRKGDKGCSYKDFKKSLEGEMK